MHGKYRRRLRAGRDLLHRRRDAISDDHGDLVELDHGDSADSPPEPITLTIIMTLPVETSASSTEWTTVTSLVSSAIATTTQTTDSLDATATSTSTTSTTSTTTSLSQSIITPLPSVLPPSATSSTTTKGSSPEAQANLTTSSTSLSGGGIAGIVIGCLVLLAAVVLFFLRKCLIQKRKRSTGAWTMRSGMFTPTPFGFEEPKSFPAASFPPTFAQVESKRNSMPHFVPPPPPTAPPAVKSPIAPYDSPSIALFNQYLSGGPPPSAFAATSPTASLFQATVVCTFVITLPDELPITVGEKMRVLAEYDDGWALCMKTDGEQGMVPLECLDQGGPSSNITGLGVMDNRGSRRLSSLDAGAMALKVTRS